MSLGRLMLEDGVELELSTDVKSIFSLLDAEVPRFSCEGYGYRIGSLRGVLGSQLKLLIKPWERATATELTPCVVVLEVESLKGGGVKIRIPPREHWGDEEALKFDEDGKLFSSFVFQLLNSLQSRGLVSLPGQLPVT